MKAIFTTFLFCLSIVIASAQVSSPPHCGTDEMWGEMVHRDSSLLTRRHQVDSAIIERSYRPAAAGTRVRGVAPPPATVIPVVIYTVYSNAGIAANISMTQIQSQMDKLNEDFAPYGFVFCYAQRNVLDTSYFTPQAGDSAGVFRINSGYTNVSMYVNDAQLKALSPLPAANYLRIFIVATITPSNVLGYTIITPGGGPEDGIVMRSDVFGSNDLCPSCYLYPNYNEGASLTHEVGHYLSLYHTFQGGCDTGSTFQSCQAYGDQVCDTPPTTGSFGCPSPAPLSCDGIHAELIDNYMDYTDDPCKSAFTAGQKARMDQGVTAYHNTLVSTQNLISTGVTCVDLTSQYADFSCANFNGCAGRPMTFYPLIDQGLTYTWDFGDGTTYVGDTAVHTYSSTGQYQVTLSAVDTTQGINASSTTAAFITQCYPISCVAPKLDFEYGFIDFSSGTPIAVNHPTAYPNPYFADFFNLYYREDGAGHPLFHLGARSAAIGNPFFAVQDSSYNIVDSLGLQYASGTDILVPVPGKRNTYCFIASCALDTAQQNRQINMLYTSIIDAHTGTPYIPAGKRLVPVNIPASTPHNIFYQMTAMPNCDGTKVWVVVNYFNSHFTVYSLDSTETLTFHQSYTLPDTNSYPSLSVVSPNGRKIALTYSAGGGDSLALGVLDFDKATGDITGFSNIYTVAPPYISDALEDRPCFSPDSRFLYLPGACCDYPYANTVNYYQYDLCSGNPYASRKTIFSYPVGDQDHYPILWTLIGPDEKLYIGHSTDPGNAPDAYILSVINNPNTLENGSNSTGYNHNGPNIIPPDCPYYGVYSAGFAPCNDMHDAFSCSWQSGVPNMFSYCPTSCRTYQFHADDCYTTQWNFGDAGSGSQNVSSLAEPQHVFSGPGAYLVKLITGAYTFTDMVHIAAPTIQIGGTAITPCPLPYANYSIATIQPGVNYNWTVTNGTPTSVNGQTGLNIQWNTADTTGTITVIGIDTILGCTDTAILSVRYHANDSIATGYISATICQGSTYTFGSRTLTAAGTYSDTVTLFPHCRSVTVLTLSYTSSSSQSTNVSAGICQGSTYSFDGNIYSSAGDYPIRLPGANGCDSLVTLHLTTTTTGSASGISICSGSSYDFHGHIITSAGLYTDTLVNSLGCDSILTLSVLVDAGPTVTWTAGMDTVNAHSGAITLSGGTPAGGTYGGAGVYGNIFYPDSVSGGSHTLVYTYTDANGCRGIASQTFVITGISDIGLDGLIDLHPNPANSRVVAQSELFTTSEITMSLYDMTGRLITVPIERGIDRATFDISGLSDGVYSIRFTINGAEVSKRFVKIE